MREVNFSIPNANKASVSITTALYDRRALDCTSTLPLINSLNNLAYLTTSSGRIRDILTVDGGIERLVCILKEGRSKDHMEMWKWNLAFQCIVNIGVRGSEAVRTRVVEADMVPVIATILDNYFQVHEKRKERAEAENRRKCPLGSFGSSRSFSRSSSRTDAHSQRSERSRRHAPPPIAIPETPSHHDQDDPTSDTTPTGPAANLSLSSPPERTSFPQHRSQRSHGGQAQFTTPGAGSSRQATDQPMSAVPMHGHGMFGLRPVRDTDRLPSMIPTLNTELSSQPQSPTTPSGPSVLSRSPSRTGLGRARRPSIRHQLSISGSDDDGQVEEEAASEESNDVEAQREPHVDIQSDIVMQDVVDDDLESRTDAVTLAASEDETFNITHRTSTDGSAVNNPNQAATPTQGAPNFPANQAPALNPLNATPPSLHQTPAAWLPPRTLNLDRMTPAPSSVPAAMPHDNDVLMSLQLLAYVSKYCNLRSYFQQSHLVPRLKIGKELQLLDQEHSVAASPVFTVDSSAHGIFTPPSTSSGDSIDEEQNDDDDWDNEFVKKPGEKPFNIFPLIEKFTQKPSSSRHGQNPPLSPQQNDMSYWAGVVMRNLCRKDDSRGGIRQCAYWQCGKWEEYTRQFAKCRRCRRTKYCSKECQKGAWGSHRFWCVAADDAREGGEGSSERGHRHHHHRSHGHHHHGSAERGTRPGYPGATG